MYQEYTAESESPRNYNFWCGVSAISTVMKRKIYFQRGFFKIFPNQYIILVGPPGVGKGTAMNPAIDLVKEAGNAHYLADRLSAEKIIDILASGFSITQATVTGGFQLGKESCATITAAEASILLTASDWMLPLLCTFWDKNEFDYQTKSGGSQLIKNLSVGLLGGCTPDYIRKLNVDSMAAVASGFTSRTIFVFANEKHKSIAWPDMTKANSLTDDLVEDLKYIGNLSGEMKFEPLAKALFISFYNNIKVDDFESEVIVNFKARMWSHVVKAAMVLSISEDDSLIIKEEHISKSIQLVETVLNTLDVTFRAVGESPIAEAQDRIMRFIEKKGVCTRSEIIRSNWRHVTDEDLTRIMTVLKAIHFVTEKMIGNTIQYTHVSQAKGVTP